MPQKAARSQISSDFLNTHDRGLTDANIKRKAAILRRVRMARWSGMTKLLPKGTGERLVVTKVRTSTEISLSRVK